MVGTWCEGVGVGGREGLWGGLGWVRGRGMWWAKVVCGGLGVGEVGGDMVG